MDREQEQAEKMVDDLIAWRYRRARDLGLKKAEASAFAGSELPMAKLRELIANGCPPATAARILL